MEVEFLKSKIWLRWLELRKKAFGELNKEERAEYQKLKPIVCKELTKLQSYIPKNRKGRMPQK